MKPLAAYLVLVSLMVPQAFAKVAAFESIVERPASHIWDRDNLFRSAPEALAEISKTLTDLEEESDFEFYLVTYSSLIGEKPEPFALRCHDEWLGEENDGLVVVLSFNETTSGVVGRSRKLYESQFIERGMMPRVSFTNLETIVKDAISEFRKEEEQIERVRVFTKIVAGRLGERLVLTEEVSASKENYHFMGWMALALLGCGVLVALLSRVAGSVDLRTKKTYYFPEFTVPQRLKASNGGGKISVVDFESPPPSSGGR